jgi:hypothetical protein
MTMTRRMAKKTRTPSKTNSCAPACVAAPPAARCSVPAGAAVCEPLRRGTYALRAGGAAAPTRQQAQTMTRRLLLLRTRQRCLAGCADAREPGAADMVRRARCFHPRHQLHNAALLPRTLRTSAGAAASAPRPHLPRRVTWCPQVRAAAPPAALMDLLGGFDDAAPAAASGANAAAALADLLGGGDAPAAAARTCGRTVTSAKLNVHVCVCMHACIFVRIYDTRASLSLYLKRKFALTESGSRRTYRKLAV